MCVGDNGNQSAKTNRGHRKKSDGAQTEFRQKDATNRFSGYGGSRSDRGWDGEWPYDPPASAFEVVSVKLNNSTDTRDVALQYLPGGRFVARGVPLFILIQEAYKGERIAPSAEFQKLDGSVIQRRYD